jgi:uncharacterized protein YpmB
LPSEQNWAQSLIKNKYMIAMSCLIIVIVLLVCSIAIINSCWMSSLKSKREISNKKEECAKLIDETDTDASFYT